MNITQKFIELVNNPFKFRIYLLTKLPSAFFSGVRVLECDETKSTVVVPYKWFSKNPFRSTYFACLSMAAEMSTGLLALVQVYKREPGISMLVTRIQGDFVKKAIGRTTFTCNDGLQIKQTIDESIKSSESKVYTAKSYGRNDAGEIVAIFDVTWSFKVKRKA